MHFSTLVLLTAAAAVQAANVVKQNVVYSATGTTDVVANGFGCVNITPAGKASQLGCVGHVFNNGFTVRVTDGKTKAVTACSIAGTQGACGPAGVSLKVDLTGGTGTAPPPSGPGGTTTLSLAQQQNKPIAGNSALAAAAGTAPTSTPAAAKAVVAAAGAASASASATGTSSSCGLTARAFVA